MMLLLMAGGRKVEELAVEQAGLLKEGGKSRK